MPKSITTIIGKSKKFVNDLSRVLKILLTPKSIFKEIKRKESKIKFLTVQKKISRGKTLT